MTTNPTDTTNATMTTNSTDTADTTDSAELIELMSIFDGTVGELQEAATDALLNMVGVFILAMARINEHQEPMSHWDLPECVINLDARRCARVYVVSAKLNLEHLQYLRLIKSQTVATWTEQQKRRAGPLYLGLEQVACLLTARKELLERVLARYDITEE